MTKQATYIPTNSTITVVAVKGGWTTVKFADGTEKKVRNGEISEVVVGPDRRHTDSKKETAKMENQAAEVKKPTPPVRPAAPAHFVGDVAPDKVAKIKDTKFDLSRYFVSDTKTPTGRRTIDCADDVAAQLRGLPIDEVYEHAAEATGIDVALLKVTYGHLNVGMQRMSLGNRIRGAVKAKEQEAAKAEAKAKKEANIAARAKQREEEAAKKAEAKAKKEANIAARAKQREEEAAKKAEAKAKREAEAQAAKEAADKAKAEAKAKKEADALAKKSVKLAEKTEKTEKTAA